MNRIKEKFIFENPTASIEKRNGAVFRLTN